MLRIMSPGEERECCNQLGISDTEEEGEGEEEEGGEGGGARGGER